MIVAEKPCPFCGADIVLISAERDAALRKVEETERKCGDLAMKIELLQEERDEAWTLRAEQAEHALSEAHDTLGEVFAYLVPEEMKDFERHLEDGSYLGEVIGLAKSMRHRVEEAEAGAAAMNPYLKPVYNFVTEHSLKIWPTYISELGRFNLNSRNINEQSPMKYEKSLIQMLNQGEYYAIP